MAIHVAYDQYGRILSVAPEGADVPQPGAGGHVVAVATFELAESTDLPLGKIARDFHVDVTKKTLERGPIAGRADD